MSLTASHYIFHGKGFLSFLLLHFILLGGRLQGQRANMEDREVNGIKMHNVKDTENK